MKVLAEKAVVVGTGLIGASLASAAKQAGVFARVSGVGRSEANLQAALSAGHVDVVTTRLDEALDGADLVVLAVPVDTAVALLPEVVEATGESCLLTDVGSVKTPICEAAVAAGAAARFVGAHPMAGGTDSGAVHADPDLFRGRVAVVTPTPETDAAGIEVVERLWQALGSRVVTMGSREHDATVAVTSHLPQLLATCLAETATRCDDRGHLEELIAGGFRDTSRLAASDVAMWASIVDLNSEAIVEAMDAFTAGWERLRAAIEAGDAAAVESILTAGCSMRESIGK